MLKCQRGPSLPLLFSLLCIYTGAGVNIKRRSAKGRKAANSITMQDVKGQEIFKV